MNVPANCMMIALGASVILRVIIIQAPREQIAGNQASRQRQQHRTAQTRSI